MRSAVSIGSCITYACPGSGLLRRHETVLPLRGSAVPHAPEGANPVIEESTHFAGGCLNYRAVHSPGCTAGKPPEGLAGDPAGRVGYVSKELTPRNDSHNFPPEHRFVFHRIIHGGSANAHFAVLVYLVVHLHNSCGKESGFIQHMIRARDCFILQSRRELDKICAITRDT